MLSYIFSAMALLISLLTYINQRRATKAAEKERFHDDPQNAYTVKLDSISKALYHVADEIKSLSKDSAH